MDVGDDRVLYQGEGVTALKFYMHLMNHAQRYRLSVQKETWALNPAANEAWAAKVVGA